MQLIDAVVLVGATDPENSHHDLASRYLDLLRRDDETFLPLISAIEFDLVLKGRKYTIIQREDAFDWLSYFAPSFKIASNSISSIRTAVELQQSGMGYFDSLVTSLAIENDATVVTTDKEIGKIAKTRW